MALGWITGIILFVAVGALAIVGAIALYNASEEKHPGYCKTVDEVKVKKLTKRGTWSIILAVIMFLVFIVVPFSFHTVDTGEVAVVKHLGKAKEVHSCGTYFDFWMTNQYQKIDGKVQSIDIVTQAYSSDAQTMDIAMTLQYQVLTDKAINIVSQYGTLDALTNRITAISTEKTKAVLSSHKAMDIIANRQDMSPAVEEAIRGAIGEEYYVNVVAVVLTNIDFSDAFETAVEEKMVAEQKQLKAQYENQTKVAQAEADATAKVVAAQAEAEANALLEKSLTDKILQEMYLDKWDGKLPTVVAGEDNGIMFSVDGEE